MLRFHVLLSVFSTASCIQLPPHSPRMLQPCWLSLCPSTISSLLFTLIISGHPQLHASFQFFPLPQGQELWVCTSEPPSCHFNLCLYVSSPKMPSLMIQNKKDIKNLYVLNLLQIPHFYLIVCTVYLSSGLSCLSYQTASYKKTEELP